MKMLFKILSWLALFVTVVPSILFLRGSMELDRVKFWMLAATIMWFIATPCWMGRPSRKQDEGEGGAGQ